MPRVCLKCADRFRSAEWTCPSCGWTPEWQQTWPAFAPALAHGHEGFSPDFFSQLRNAESGSFWFRARNRLIVWALQKYFADARSLLEVGCGTGFVLSGIQQAFPGWMLAGSEILSDGLSFARSRLPDVSLLQMDARHIPFEAEFDVVGSFDVLEHIEEDDIVIEQLFQATRPGGGIMLTVPQHPLLWSVVDEHSHHKRRYTRQALVGKVESAGFQVVRVTSFVSALLPAVVLSRRIQNRRTGAVGAELELPAALDFLLEQVMSAERTLIAAGASLPVGVSLLLVAKRNA